jgi:HTH-type transcriptional regulator/antitoxin HigA
MNLLIAAFDMRVFAIPAVTALIFAKFCVFDIPGNRYRLICAIHYNRGRVYVRHVLSHAEYDRGRWKQERARGRPIMARQSKQVVHHGADDKYLKLVRAFPLRPLRSDAELDGAIAMIDSLITRDDLDMGEEDYLDVLSELVQRFEAEHDPIEPVADADMVRFLLQSNDMSQAELAERSEIAESTISEVLAGKRKLSRRHIAALSKVFRVSPAVFFADAVEMTT